jgi:hypothetical protein
MSKQILLSSVLALLTSSYPSVSAVAEVLPSNSVIQSTQANPPEPPVTPQEQIRPDPDAYVQSSQEITIPEASVVAVTFCSAIKFEDEREDRFPVTLFLARPIMDNDGGILAPVNSLVNAQVEPTSEGVKIQVDAIVIGGRLISVKTSALSIPILSTTKEGDGYDDYAYGEYDSDMYYGRPGRGVALNVANGLQSWLGNQEILGGTASGLLGAGLAIAAGVTAATDKKPEPAKLIEVPEGGMLIFPLLSPVALPPRVIQSVAAIPPEQTPTSLCSRKVNVAENSSSEGEETSDQTSNEGSDQTSNEGSDQTSDESSDTSYGD